LRNSASCWLLLQEYITMYGPLNIKYIQYNAFVELVSDLKIHGTEI